MTELPQNLDQAVEQARAATLAALADGLTRLQVELAFPELRTMPIAQTFLEAFEERESSLRVFFPDPGAAALARRDWGDKPYAIRGIGELKAQIQSEESLFLFVEPSSVEVLQVEELCAEAGDRPVVLLAPRMEDVATVGIGYAARQLRERFISTFETCYYLRPMDGAALMRCYPGPWQVWKETESGDYTLIAEEPQKPSGEQLEQLLLGTSTDAEAKPQRQGLLAGMRQFLRALNQ
jgi:hypothetical protein